MLLAESFVDLSWAGGDRAVPFAVLGDPSPAAIDEELGIGEGTIVANLCAVGFLLRFIGNIDRLADRHGSQAERPQYVMDFRTVVEFAGHKVFAGGNKCTVVRRDVLIGLF